MIEGKIFKNDVNFLKMFTSRVQLLNLLYFYDFYCC